MKLNTVQKDTMYELMHCALQTGQVMAFVTYEDTLKRGVELEGGGYEITPSPEDTDILVSWAEEFGEAIPEQSFDRRRVAALTLALRQ